MTVDRPNLDFLRKSAKDLKRALARGEPSAHARFDAVFQNAGSDPKLADCLHVIAREAGFDSWPKLKLDLELRQADRESLAGQLGAALYFGRLRHAERILALEPGIADASLPLQLALFDEDRVFAALDDTPNRLIQPEKVTDASRIALDALTRVCTSHYHRLRPDLAPIQMRIARRLLDLGADPNTRHPSPDDPSAHLSVLYGCLCVAGNLPLAELLLDSGAVPNDGECAYHACEMETLDGLKLLLRYGLTFQGTNALLRMLDFDRYDGVELLLSNGASPNEGLAHLNEADRPKHGNALHHAIRRGRDGRFAELLLRYGADGQGLANGRSAYALAAVVGNRSMVETLEASGLATPLSPVETFLAAIATGRRREALGLWARDKDIVSTLSHSDQRLHIDFARQKGRLEALELMNEVGFDPNATDLETMTALHAAAWFGHADYVRFYLGLDPDISLINMYGATALGNAIHGSENCPARADGAYVETARMLVEAGYPIEPDKGHLAMGSDDVTVFLEERLSEG